MEPEKEAALAQELVEATAKLEALQSRIGILSPKPQAPAFNMLYSGKHERPRVKFHVHVPLYRGLPKELQSGWCKYDDHRLIAWDNTTDLTPFLKMLPNPKMFELHIYCGTCGCHMVKGRRPDLAPSPTATLKLL